MRKGLDLDRVVLLGRTFGEYVRYFAVAPEEFRQKRILDVAAGVSSFCPEATAQGFNVVAFDPIYQLAPEEIALRCAEDLDFVVRAIGDLKVYRWGFYKNPQRMRHFRERSWRTFLDDYRRHRGERYMAGLLPRTPFVDRQFDISLVSYFLFVYQDQLSYEFHKDSILELMRIS
ncbi:MAG: class I SAM-dependent methyltransferase, partial [Verrucomicrobiales bacterium]|nr:class I SAM-dependent methyltransferase [Verrucomicrobiales bacterium]